MTDYPEPMYWLYQGDDSIGVICAQWFDIYDYEATRLLDPKTGDPFVPESDHDTAPGHWGFDRQEEAEVAAAKVRLGRWVRAAAKLTHQHSRHGSLDADQIHLAWSDPDAAAPETLSLDDVARLVGVEL